MEAPKPKIDTEKASQEVKNFIDRNKMNKIDWGTNEIEMYPHPCDESLPELSLFATQWEKFFAYAETLTIDEDGTGFPKESVSKFEAVLKEIEDKVNNDKEYWDRIRSEVMPLYESPKGIEPNPKTMAVLEKWKNRWKAVHLFYDVMDLRVRTTQMWTNKKTGERTRGDVISERDLPAGFVIKVL